MVRSLRVISGCTLFIILQDINIWEYSSNTIIFDYIHFVTIQKRITIDKYLKSRTVHQLILIIMKNFLQVIPYGLKYILLTVNVDCGALVVPNLSSVRDVLRTGVLLSNCVDIVNNIQIKLEECNGEVAKFNKFISKNKGWENIKKINQVLIDDSTSNDNLLRSNLNLDNYLCMKYVNFGGCRKILFDV